MMSEECPNCGQLTNTSFSRLVKDSCGHSKCRMCLLYEEQGCKACHDEIRIENIGKYDCPTSISKILNSPCDDIKDPLSREEIVLPLELVINKNSKSKENEIEFFSTSSSSNLESHCRNDIFDSDKDSYKVTADNGTTDIADRLYIPKIETCDVILNIRTHLNTDNVVTIKEASCKEEQAMEVGTDSQETKLEFTRKEKAKNKSSKCPDRSHISVVPGVPERYKCNVCSKIFRNKKGKCYHDACVTGIKPYQCTICDRSFVKRSHFEYHERVHSGFKPYKCNLCDKAFPQRNKLNRHMYSHCKEKQFVCPKCNKGYSKRDDLKNHLNAHTSTTTYSCKACTKSFRLLTNLKRHMRTHTNERPHTCDQCNKSFKDKSLLIRHKRTHGKDRPFSCAHCNRVFLSKSELKRHLAVHSDEKPFSCEYCQTVFRRKDNLNRHIRHHHSEDMSNEIEKSQNATTMNENKKAPKTKAMNKIKQKQKPKKIQKITSGVSNKSPSKLSMVYVNSREQINSRLDSMGNITPVIRTTGELSNAVPVINGPISIKQIEDKSETRKKTFTYTEPIPLAEAVVINRRIEEKLYPQNVTNHNYFFRNHVHRNDKHNPNNTVSNPSIVRTNCHARDSINLNECNTSKSVEFESTNNAITDFVVEVVNVHRNEEVKSKDDISVPLVRQDQINYVSTIKKHTFLHDDLNVREEFNTVNDMSEAITNSSLPKMIENTNDLKQTNMHWRRRTAEILKPCNQ